MRTNKLLNLLRRNARVGAYKAEDSTVYLYDVLVSAEADTDWWGGVSAEAFVKQLAGMSGPINVRINSPGGDVFAGVAIANAIRQYPDQVTVYVDGLAASAASIVAVAGQNVQMAPGAMMMIHQAWTIVIGNADDLEAEAKILRKIDGDIAAAYGRRAAAKGKAGADFAALMADETWLTVEECLELGLADAEASEATKGAKTNGVRAWDLSAFAHPPKDLTVTVSVTVEDEDDDGDDGETLIIPADEIDAATHQAAYRALHGSA